MAEVPELVVARWGAFSGIVPELPLVPKVVVGLQSVVGGAKAAISKVRPLADSGMRLTVFGIPTVKKPGARAPRFDLLARPCCGASKG